MLYVIKLLQGKIKNKIKLILKYHNYNKYITIMLII